MTANGRHARRLWAALVLASCVAMAPRPAAAQAELGDAWLSSGGAAPEGSVNPEEIVEPLDLPLFGTGLGVLGASWLATLIESAVSLPTLSVYGYTYSSGYYSPHPCRDATLGVAFIPVLGPWLGLAVLDQCGIRSSHGYRNSDGELAFTYSGARRDLDIPVSELAAYVPLGIIQLVGAVLAIAGAAGHTTRIRFADGVTLGATSSSLVVSF